MIRIEVDLPNKKADYSVFRNIIQQNFECWITAHTFYYNDNGYHAEAETGTSTVLLHIYQPTLQIMNKLMEYVYA